MEDIAGMRRQLAESLSEEELLQLLLEKHGEGAASSPTEQADALRARCAAFNAPRDYGVGDLVCWKDGLKNRKRPAYGRPAVVLEFLDGQFREEDGDAGTPFYMEPLDVRLGLLDEMDGEFLTYLYNGRRFRRLSQEELG